MYFFICLRLTPWKDLEFEIDDSKHQNILSTTIFTNSLRCSHHIPWSLITLYLNYVSFSFPGKYANLDETKFKKVL